jgi:hypothetical protein
LSKRTAHFLFIWRFCLGRAQEWLLAGSYAGFRAKKCRPAQLRADYKTDLALMVAETYAREKDLYAALDGLARIEPG